MFSMKILKTFFYYIKKKLSHEEYTLLQCQSTALISMKFSDTFNLKNKQKLIYYKSC